MVAVLWFLVVVATVVTPFAVGARNELLVQTNRRAQLQLTLIADVLAQELADRGFHGTLWREVGTGTDADLMRWCSARSFSIGHRSQPTSGLIDLNAADDDLLSAGFATLGFTDAEARDAAATVKSFRTYIHTRTLHPVLPAHQRD